MAVFREPWLTHPLDWEILRHSPIAMYHRPEIMQEDVAWFAQAGYDIREFDCAAWASEDDLHKDLATKLKLPDYYGHNLDAFDECIHDVEIKDESGLLIVFRRYDAFAERAPKAAHAILDTIACGSRWYSLLGLRLIAMVQSDDPTIRFDSLGALGAQWNRKERLNKNRGL